MAQVILAVEDDRVVATLLQRAVDACNACRKIGIMRNTEQVPSSGELSAIDEYWRAANYLTVGQIYLQSNALLRKPLRVEDVKPRLLGHWGTSPRRQLADTGELTERCQEALERHRVYIAEHLDDMPEIRDWTWSGAVLPR